MIVQTLSFFDVLFYERKDCPLKGNSAPTSNSLSSQKYLDTFKNTFFERSSQNTSFSSRKQPANACSERKQFADTSTDRAVQTILTHAHTNCPPVTWVTHIPCDLCSPTRETHITSGVCFQVRGTYISSDVFPCRGNTFLQEYAFGGTYITGEHLYLFIYSFPPPYNDIVVDYKNPLENGRKAQQNHEAYTTWAFPIKLQNKLNMRDLKQRRQRRQQQRQKQLVL